MYMCPEAALAGTARRLNALDANLTYRLAPPGQPQPPWQPMTDLAAPTPIGQWHDQLTARTGDRRVAASFLGDWVASAAAMVWVLPVLAEARLPVAGPAGVAVRRHRGGWLDGVAVTGHRVAVLPDDPAAGMYDVVVVADRQGLIDALVGQLLSMAGIFTAVHTAVPVGLPALWGDLADAVGTQALWLARLLGRDPLRTWALAAETIDRVAARQPLLRQRPRIVNVTCQGGEEPMLVRGTCCLHYRTVKLPDPDGDGYCETCPLRTQASRAGRLCARLDKRS